MKKVRVIAATVKNQIEFRQHTLLGQSLSIFQKQTGLDIAIFPNNSGVNRKGLGALYNAFLQTKYADETLLFIHDDVYVHDWHLVRRLNDAMQHFDVIGLVGHAKPDLDEPSWNLAWNREKHPDGHQPKELFSGVMSHLVNGKKKLHVYGPTPRACVLMDGLFIAVNAQRVIEKGIRFDPRFEFHFYDLDFCRQCHGKGLKLGTWPIAVTHASHGNYNSPAWSAARDLYLSKWRPDNSSMQQKMRQAIAAYKAGNIQKAERLCKLLLLADKNCLVAINVLGLICAQQRQFSRALELFTRAVQLNPGDAEAIKNQGKVLNELKRYEEAVNSYKQALAIKPDLAEANYQLRDVLRKIGRLKT